MPTVRMPNGDLVRFPDEMPRAEIGQFIESKFPGAFAQPERKSTVGEEFMRGIRTSIEGARTAGTAGLAALRDDEAAQREAALAGIERSREIAEQYGTAPGFAPVRERYEEAGLPAAIGEAIAQTPRLLAQQSGPIASFIGGARLGAGLMPVPALKPIAGLLGAGAAVAPQFTGFNIERQAQEQIEQGVAPEDVEIDFDTAAKAAAAQAAIESGGQALVLGRGLVRSIVGGNRNRAFSATDTNKLVEASQKTLLGAARAGGVRGLATEVPVEVAQQVVERYQAGADVMSPEALAEYGEAAFAAATVGSALGTVGGVSERVGSRVELDAQRRREAARQAEQQEPVVTPEPVVAPTSEEAVEEVVDEEVAFTAPTEEETARLAAEDEAFREAEGQLAADREEARLAQQEAEAFREAEEQLTREAGERAEVAAAAEPEPAARQAAREAAAREEAIGRSRAEREAFAEAEGQLAREAEEQAAADVATQSEETEVVDTEVVEEDTDTIAEEAAEEVVTPESEEEVVTSEPETTPETTPETASEAELSTDRKIDVLESVNYQDTVAAQEDTERRDKALLDEDENLQPLTREEIVSFGMSEATLKNEGGVNKSYDYNFAKSFSPVLYDGPDHKNRYDALIDQVRALEGWAKDDRHKARPKARKAAQAAAGEALKRARFYTDLTRYGTLEEAAPEAAPVAENPDAAAMQDDLVMSEYYDSNRSFAQNMGVFVNEIVTEKSFNGPESLNSALMNNPNISEATKMDIAGRVDAQLDEIAQQDFDNYADFGDNFLPVRERVALGKLVPTNAIERLRAGDLRGALELVRTESTRDINKLTQATLKGLGNTKIAFEPNLVNPLNGEQVGGLYRPTTDTIIINESVPLDLHTLLHEAGHAVTSHEIAKNTSTARQLRKIFDEVRPSLGSSYGATSLDEFIAEHRSNPQFRAELGGISVDGQRVSVLTRIKYAIVNMYRRLRGLDSKQPGSALDAVDKLVVDITSPAPQSRLGDDLFSSTVQREEEKFLEDTINNLASGPISDSDRQIFSDYVPTMKGMSRRATFRILPLNTIADYIENTLPDFSAAIKDLFKTIQRQSGKKRQYNNKTKALYKELRAFFKGQPELKKLYNTAINFMTIYRVDMTKPRSFYEGNYFTYLKGDKLETSPKYKSRKELDEALTKFKEDNPDVQNISRVNEDPIKLEAYDWIQKNAWGPLIKQKPAAVKMFNKHKRAYEIVYEDLVKTLNKRIDEVDADDRLKKSYKDKILFDLLNKQQIEPYFPLYRKGDKWLVYQGIDPTTGGVAAYKELFETDAARQKRVRELRNDAELNQQLEAIGQNLAISTFDRAKGQNQSPNVDRAFAFSILGKVQQNVIDRGNAAAEKATKAAEKKGATKEEIEQAARKARSEATKGASQLESLVFDAIVEASPERSLIRSFSPRGDVLGFKEDQIEVLMDKLPTYTDQIVRLEFETELDKHQADLRELAEKYAGTDKQEYASDVQAITQEFIDFNRNPTIPKWSRITRSMGFWWTLGLNVSSALVNMFVIPIVVLPYLGGKYGYFNTMSSIIKNTNLYLKTGMRRQVKDFEGVTGETEFDGPSLTNPNYEDPASMPEGLEEYAPLAAMLDDRGLASTTTIGDMLDMDGTDTPYITRANGLMGFMFHQGERMTRHVTAMTAYDLELQKRKAEKGTLTEEDYAEIAEEAILTTEETNSGALTETAPRLAQGPLTSILLMYKRFGISMLYVQFKMAKQALQPMKPGDRAVALKQIAGMFAMSGLLAGIQGMPLIGIMRRVWNMVFDDDEDDFDTAMTSYFEEGPYNGLLYSMGLDIGPRIGMSNLLYRSLPNQEQTSLAKDMGEFLGGPMASIIIRMLDQGVPLMQQGEYYRFSEKVMPSAIANPLRAFRFGTQGANTMRGDPIVEDIGAGAILSQFFGFAPSPYTRQIEINARNKFQDNKIIREKTNLLKNLNKARRFNLAPEVIDMLEKIAEFNQRHPEAAIDAETIERSRDSYTRTTEAIQQTGGVFISPRRRATVMRETELLFGP